MPRPPAQSSPSAPPLATVPGCDCISTVSVAPSPPTRTGCARIAFAIRSPPSSDSSRAKARAARSSGTAKATTPQPSMPVPISAGSSSVAAATSWSSSCLERVLGVAVALDRPAVRAAGREHAGVLARAVVVDRLLRAALLPPAVELVLAAAGRGQQLAHGLDVPRRAVVRGGRDRELLLAELRVGARERQRLQRLRGRPQRGGQRRVAEGRDGLAVANGDAVHLVDGLDERPAPHGYPERLSHGRERRCLSYRRSKPGAAR